jgi:hypothetical protein
MDFWGTTSTEIDSANGASLNGCVIEAGDPAEPRRMPAPVAQDDRAEGRHFRGRE